MNVFHLDIYRSYSSDVAPKKCFISKIKNLYFINAIFEEFSRSFQIVSINNGFREGTRGDSLI